MKKTTIGVEQLVNFMIKKYGLVCAIILLKQQYNYKIIAGKRNTKFTDDNEFSSFYGESYIARRYLKDEEKLGLREILKV